MSSEEGIIAQKCSLEPIQMPLPSGIYYHGMIAVQALRLPESMAAYPKPKSMEARKALQRNTAEAHLLSSKLTPQSQADVKIETAGHALKAYRYEFSLSALQNR